MNNHGRMECAKLWGALLVCAVFTLPGFAQEPFAYITQPTPIGAQMIAFGDGHSASAYDVSCMFSNPASLSFLRAPTMTINRTRFWSSGVITDNIAIPISIAKIHTLAVGATIDHAGYNQPLPENAAVEFQDYGFDLGYSVTLIPTLSVGLQASGRMVSQDGIDYTGGWVSVGAYYFPQPGIRYGAHLQGFGSGFEYDHDTSRTRILTGIQLPKCIEISAEMQYPAQSHAPVFVLAVSTERNISDKISRIKGAMEIMPWHFLSARVGYVTSDGQRSLRLGLGVHVEGLRLEYAVAPGPRAQRVDAMTLTYAWERR
jgi:hypothetical protein